MRYTFTINDTNSKAKSLINMLSELKRDYDFIESREEPLLDESHPLIAKELLYRQEQTLQNKQGKSWKELQKEL